MSWRVSILSSVLLLPAMSDGDDAGRMDFFYGSSVRIDPHQNSTPVAASSSRFHRRGSCGSCSAMPSVSPVEVAAVSRANASSAASVAQCVTCQL